MTGSSGPPLRITPLRTDDASDVLRIYAEGIACGHATFETTAPEWDAWDAGHLRRPRLAARRGERALGWAALSAVSSRCVCGGVAEVSVYVAAAERGHGIGRALLDALVRAADDAGLWTLEAGIFPENVASIRLHERCGFRIVGTRERIGRHQGTWRDVVLMERRSDAVGISDGGA